MEIFSDTQGQLTPQFKFGSGQNDKTNDYLRLCAQLTQMSLGIHLVLSDQSLRAKWVANVLSYLYAESDHPGLKLT